MTQQYFFRKADPFQGPKLGSCLTLGNELSEETHVLTKQEILLGKGTGWRAGLLFISEASHCGGFSCYGGQALAEKIFLGKAEKCRRPGVAAGRTNPTSKDRWLSGRRRA